jgi:1-deoxy-D-xylulose-5-phosphate synthase
LPGIQIYSVENYSELENRLTFAIEDDCLSIVRYQKGSEISYDEDLFVNGNPNITYTKGIEEADAVILTYGTITYQAYKAMKLLSAKHKIGIIKLIKIFPVNISEILKLSQNAKLIYILEEGIKSGGVAEKTASLAYSLSCQKKIFINAIENFVQHGSKEEIYRSLGFDENSIADTIDKELSNL